jgi:hypothetical protein
MENILSLILNLKENGLFKEKYCFEENEKSFT